MYDQMTKIIKKIILCGLLVGLLIPKMFDQSKVNTIPTIIEKNGRHALLVDGKPFFIFGGQAHNSSAWPGMLPGVWLAVEQMHLNTLEVPIYWEQIEPLPGKFDFSPIKTLLVQSRKHKVHLVLLWFATWKNGSNHYMPEWMKQDALKYPNITGIKGQPVDSPSPNVSATMEADIKAFAAVMRFIKSEDTQHTVIMIQVENESGSWGSVRDYSGTAQKLFDGQVPAELLKPDILKELKHIAVPSGSWQQVFGTNADEYFHAWSIARFIGKVAAAGKAEYPLPMYVNAALRDPLSDPSATTYESGGPTDNVIPIWKAAAPSINILAPDIYISGSEKVLKVLDLYDRQDNALFVPEIALTSVNSKYLYEVIARGGIGFSPFGIDDTSPEATGAATAAHLAPFAKEYEMAAPMMRELAEWGFEGKIKTAVEREDHADRSIDLGSWQAVVSFNSGRGDGSAQVNSQSTGKLMIVQLAENKFILIGTACHVTFKPIGINSGRAWQYLKVEEGSYHNGTFNLLRVRNGDETDWGGPQFGITPAVLRTSLVLR
jgi:hypothetical protein